MKQHGACTGMRCPSRNCVLANRPRAQPGNLMTPTRCSNAHAPRLSKASASTTLLATTAKTSPYTVRRDRGVWLAVSSSRSWIRLRQPDRQRPAAIEVPLSTPGVFWVGSPQRTSKMPTTPGLQAHWTGLSQVRLQASMRHPHQRWGHCQTTQRWASRGHLHQRWGHRLVIPEWALRWNHAYLRRARWQAIVWDFKRHPYRLQNQTKMNHFVLELPSTYAETNITRLVLASRGNNVELM